MTTEAERAFLSDTLQYTNDPVLRALADQLPRNQVAAGPQRKAAALANYDRIVHGPPDRRGMIVTAVVLAALAIGLTIAALAGGPKA